MDGFELLVVYTIETHDGVWDVYMGHDGLAEAQRDLRDLAQEGVRAALLEYDVV